MRSIKIHNKYFIPFITEEVILERINILAEEINQDYFGKSPLFIVVLNGAFMFASDLFKSLNVEAEICFIKLASYNGMISSGQINTMIGLDKDISGRHVVVVEDIVDTGRTIDLLLKQLESVGPASVSVAALLHKPDATECSVKIDYLGFQVPNRFLLGYGLDYDGLGRNLRDIYQLEPQTA
jgi:hypoxanthine phosphoribosyltransferase